MTLSNHARLKYWEMNKSTLIDEVMRLIKENREKDGEITSLKKRIAIYKSI